MDVLNATEVRKNWSVTIDSVVRDRPAYIRRLHDQIAVFEVHTLNEILAGYRFRANEYKEKDGSVTLSMVDLDIVVNEADESSAVRRLAEYIKEYAEEFYGEFHIWSAAPNRRGHLPYVIKALSLTTDEIQEDIVCQNGKN